MKGSVGYAQDLAQNLRNKEIRVEVDYTGRKVGDQIKTADRHRISHVICIGDNEVKSGEFKLKNLGSGEEVTVTEATLSTKLGAKK